MLESALAVDPEGGVDLIRWILRQDVSIDLFREEIRFASREEFRAWFDEFRRKAVKG